MATYNDYESYDLVDGILDDVFPDAWGLGFEARDDKNFIPITLIREICESYDTTRDPEGRPPQIVVQRSCCESEGWGRPLVVCVHILPNSLVDEYMFPITHSMAIDLLDSAIRNGVKIYDVHCRSEAEKEAIEYMKRFGY